MKSSPAVLRSRVARSPFFSIFLISLSALNNVKFFPNKADSAKAIYEAERVYAGFSLPDILKQKYHVKVISMKDGHLDLIEEPDGELNLIEASQMRADSPTTSANAKPAYLDLDIQKFVLKNMDISYFDPKEGQRPAHPYRPDPVLLYK